MVEDPPRTPYTRQSHFEYRISEMDGRSAVQPHLPLHQCDAPTGRLALYYGGTDTVTALAFVRADELVAWVKEYAIA